VVFSGISQSITQPAKCSQESGFLEYLSVDSGHPLTLWLASQVQSHWWPFLWSTKLTRFWHIKWTNMVSGSWRLQQVGGKDAWNAPQWGLPGTYIDLGGVLGVI